MRTYSLVAGVDEDDLVVLVDTILVDPVGVENAEVPAPPANTLLRNAPQTALGLKLVDTLTDGLAVGSTYTRYQNGQSTLMIAQSTYPWGRASCGYRDGHGYGR